MTLKDLRLEKGLSLRVLGEKIGVSRTSILNYEKSNELPLKQIKKYADVFDKHSNNWIAQINTNTEPIILGAYKTEDEAKIAQESANKMIRTMKNEKDN